MPLHKITEFYKEWFSLCSNTNSKFHTTVIFKSFVKGIHTSSSYANDDLMRQTSCLSTTVISCLHKTNREF
jgi:hypothetical protein